MELVGASGEKLFFHVLTFLETFDKYFIDLQRVTFITILVIFSLVQSYIYMVVRTDLDVHMNAYVISHLRMWMTHPHQRIDVDVSIVNVEGNVNIAIHLRGCGC